jgi:hypothetical protein
MHCFELVLSCAQPVTQVCSCKPELQASGDEGHKLLVLPESLKVKHSMLQLSQTRTPSQHHKLQPIILLYLPFLCTSAAAAVAAAERGAAQAGSAAASAAADGGAGSRCRCSIRSSRLPGMPGAAPQVDGGDQHNRRSNKQGVCSSGV